MAREMEKLADDIVKNFQQQMEQVRGWGDAAAINRARSHAYGAQWTPCSLRLTQPLYSRSRSRPSRVLVGCVHLLPSIVCVHGSVSMLVPVYICVQIMENLERGEMAFDDLNGASDEHELHQCRGS